MDCNPERYKYEVAMRGLEPVRELMKEFHSVSVKATHKVHLLRPDCQRLAYCNVHDFDAHEMVTRNPAHVTCKHCARRFAPWYFKLTYVPRVVLGLPLFFFEWLGEKAAAAGFWLQRHTWVPYKK